jgi:type 1 glutamine amidotransferase
LQPAVIERKEPPTPAARTHAEIRAILRSPENSPGKPGAKWSTTNVAATSKTPLRVLLCAGPKDHGPSEHDYPLWQKRWSTLLALDDSIAVDRADLWPTKAQWEQSDVVVFYSANPGFSLDTAKDLDTHLARGKGLVYLHFAVNGQVGPDALAQRIGLSWGRGPTFRHGHVDLKLPDLNHPITRGMPSTIAFEDETYWLLTGDPSKVHILGTSVEQGQPRPILWTFEKDRGRVFVSILGHFTWTFDDPLFRLLILRGIAWSAGSDANRLDHLATIGARVQ